MATQISTVAYEQKILFTGSQAAYNAATKSASGLYFTTDTHKLYKGEVDFSQNARVVTALPTGTALAKNQLYVIVDGTSGDFVKAVATKADGSTVEIGWTKVTSIGSGSTDAEVASAKAVYDYVQGIVGGDTVVTNIAAATGTADGGKLIITQGSATTSTVTVPGVALKPSYDPTNRIITVPYTELGGTAAGEVTINLGKDLVVTAGRYNSTDETIEFWITGHDPDTDPADITVPVGDLVDEIVGGTTDTAVTTYTSSSNTLTASVRISGASGNYLGVKTGESTASDNGLYVDLSTIEQAIADNATDIGTLDTNIAALESALTTWTTLAEPTP